MLMLVFVVDDIIAAGRAARASDRRNQGTSATWLSRWLDERQIVPVLIKQILLQCLASFLFEFLNSMTALAW
jgi:hypothetical protein